MSIESPVPTPYAVNCHTCAEGNLVYMTKQDYNEQMRNPDATWKCPRCGHTAVWSDRNYEERSL